MELTAKTIEWPEKLQCLFVPTINDLPVRYRVLYGGRGGAKSWGAARALVLKAAQGRLRVLCARELQKSIRDSVHKLLVDQIEKLGLRSLFIVEQARLYVPLTGSEFFFDGIKNDPAKIKSYEGIDVCWVEEANKVTEDSWHILIPTIRKEGSEIWMTFNPEFETDYTYQYFVQNPPKNAIVQKINWRDNPWFPEVLKQEMLEMKERDRDSYLHIWEGECRNALTGAVYADQLRDVVEEGRICKVPHSRGKSVNLYWDLGRSDYTSIIFEQYVGMQRRIVDYHQNRLKHLDYYIEFLRHRKSSLGEFYNYGICWLPHDAMAKTLGTKKSVYEQLKDAGFRVKIVPKLSLHDGIMAARAIFPTCWFDEERCKEELIHSLRHYTYEEDVERGLSDKPVHNWASHAADAFRYLAVASQGDIDTKEIAVRRALESRVNRFPLIENDPLGWLR